MIDIANSPLVSCIIPVYNAEKHILTTLRSLEEQSYKSIEIIIVNDGSVDNSRQLIEEYINKTHLNIKFFDNPGKGACAARNFGFENSMGKYIQYLDADDLLSSNKIEVQIKCLENSNPNTIASCNWGRFYNNEKDVCWEKQEIDRSYSQPEMWLLDSWLGKGKGQTAIWLTPRNVLIKSGKWNENLTINQDGEFFCRVLLNCEIIEYCMLPKVYYRSENNQSISRDNPFSIEKAQSLLDSYLLYKKHSKDFNKIKLLRKGLAHNFLMFIYLYFDKFKDLSKIAEKEFYNLGYDKMWNVGGLRFKKVANVVGFKNALKLSKLIK